MRAFLDVSEGVVDVSAKIFSANIERPGYGLGTHEAVQGE